MLLKRENKENRRVVLTIQVEQEAWEKALEEAYERSKALFTKDDGSLPTRQEMEEKHGADVFYQDAVNNTFPIALVEAVRQEDISVAGAPELTVEAIGPEGYVFTALIDLYPEVKLVVMAHLYGFPAKVDEIKRICEAHGALLIEDAAEAMGATVNGKQCGSFGDYAAISYNGNKIITGSAGGCLLTNSLEDANRARKWATQARENAAWYQHEEVGYNYRMSNVVAGVVRGQYPHLEEHIAQKKAVYERYCEGLRDLPVTMNPIVDGTEPNYWLSALIIDEDAMCAQLRDDSRALYYPKAGKSCPTEILEVLAKYNAEGRPIWKPMHMQPMYRLHECIGREGSLRCRTNAYIAGGVPDVGADIFQRGLCLPSDNKLTEEQVDGIIALIHACFA